MHPRAKSYAKPLFSLCVEKNITHEMLYEIKNMSNVDDKEIRNVMRYPMISKDEKKKLIDELADAGVRVEFRNLLKLLIDFDDIKLLGDIREEYTKLYQEEYDVEIVTMNFAKEPTSEILDNVRIMLEKKLEKFVVVKWQVDSSLIGGVVIEYDSKVLDNSIKRQLKQLINNL